MKIVKIISGGQTGADVAGLIVAKELQIETGGWIPKGFLTEKGLTPSLGTDYGLIETESDKYPPRTRMNANAAHKTIIFEDCFSPGCVLTKNLCRELRKPSLTINTKDDLTENVERIKEFLGKRDDLIINIAGNRETKSPGIQERTINILKAALI